jgi:type I site-specific restriction-modification system R (restriction) subunit
MAKIALNIFYAVNCEDIDSNEFWVVNQFSIEGRNNRRPDLIVFVKRFAAGIV